MRSPIDRRLIWTLRVVCTFLLALLAGCSDMPVPKGVDGKQPPPHPTAQPRLELDGEQGFTLTEVAHVNSDVRADYQRAIGMLRHDQREQGIRLLESVVERAPDIAIPHIDLGLAYERAHQFDKARASFLAALALAPDHPAALNELGILYRRMGRFTEARASYEHALAVHPSFHYALLNLAILCDLYLQDLECALRNYEAYSTIVGEDDQVSIWLADVRNRLKSPQNQQEPIR